MIMGKSKSRATTLKTPWGQVIIEAFNSEKELKPVKHEDGTISMKLKIFEHRSVQSNETDEDISTPENMQILKDLMRESIISDIEDSLKQAQALSADIFGFGAAIQREYPDDWENMKDDWESIFSKIKLEIEVDPMLHSVGGLVKPIVPGGFE